MIRGLEPNPSAPPLTSGEGEGLETEFSYQMANDLINNAYLLKPSYKHLIDGVVRASGLLNTMRYWAAADTPHQRQHGSLAPLPHTLSFSCGYS